MSKTQTQTGTLKIDVCRDGNSFTAIVTFPNGRKSFAVVGRANGWGGEYFVQTRDPRTDRQTFAGTWANDDDVDAAIYQAALVYATGRLDVLNGGR